MEVKFIVAEKSEINEVEQSIIGWGSKPTADRDRELIEASAWNLDVYKSNPVLMLSHDYASPPIGKILWVKADETGLKFKARFANTERGREIYSLYKDDIMKAFSVGFSPKKVDTQPDKDMKYKGMNLKKVFKEVDLIEISCVSIPSNSGALVEYVKSGKIRTKSLQQEFDNILEIIESKEDLPSVEDKEVIIPLIKNADVELELDDTDEVIEEEAKAIEEDSINNGEIEEEIEEKEYSEWTETDKEIVYLVKDAEDFDVDTLKLVSLKKNSPRIEAMMGESLEDAKIEVQSLLFAKEDWTQEDAETWLSEHSMKSFNIAFETLSEDISEVLADFKESIVAEVKEMVEDKEEIELKKLDIDGAPSINDIRNAIQRVIEDTYPPRPSLSEVAVTPSNTSIPKIIRYLVDFYPIEYPNGSCIIAVYTYDNITGISSEIKYYRQPYTYEDGIATFGESEVVGEAWVLKKYEGSIEKILLKENNEIEIEIEEKSIEEDDGIDIEESDNLIEIDSDILQNAIKDVFLTFKKEDIIKNVSIKQIATDAINKARGKVTIK